MYRPRLAEQFQDLDKQGQAARLGMWLFLGSEVLLFAGLFAGILWSAAGDLARARIVKELDYFQHPLIVLVLLVAGASITRYVEAGVLALVVLILHLAAREGTRDASAVPIMPLPLVAVALALDVFRGAFG